MGTTSETDRIERSIHIQAPRERVFRALTNAEEFGTWFGADLKGQTIAPGQRVRGPITIPGYTHVEFDVVIDRVVVPGGGPARHVVHDLGALGGLAERGQGVEIAADQAHAAGRRGRRPCPGCGPAR